MIYVQPSRYFSHEYYIYTHRSLVRDRFLKKNRLMILVSLTNSAILAVALSTVTWLGTVIAEAFC